jgi:translation initiation factor 6 (eIF-6)
MILTDTELNRVKEVSKITITDYEVKGNFISGDTLLAALEDLLVSYHAKEEELENLQQEISENYELKKVNMYEEYGLSENDFL